MPKGAVAWLELSPGTQGRILDNVSGTIPTLAPASVVFMASGQGSQAPGMGVSLLDIPEVAEVFNCASEVLGRDIAALVQAEGEEAQAQLNQTKNAQAAIATLSIGIGRALEAQGVIPDALLGFSLGQVSALALADMVSIEDAFRIIDARSSAMDAAAQKEPGAMSALLKADDESVQALCEACAQDEVLVPANYNCPGQIVIAGTPAAIARAEEAWKEQGGRASRLATQGAFHSPLMESACAPFAKFLDTVSFADPRIPVICNTDAASLDASSVRQRLVAHLTSPVRFSESVLALQAAGAHTFAEVGFGGVLAGLVRRIDKELERPCIQDDKSFAAFIEARRA